MRKIILFIATSLDGFIAGPNGEIDWLFTDGDYGFNKMYSSIDTTLLGRKTYDLTLKLDPNVSRDKTNYVFAHHPPQKHPPQFQFVAENAVGFTENLKRQKGKDIWLIGGGELNTTMLNASLIDTMIVSILPVVLGKGIPLFTDDAKRTDFKTVGMKTYKSGLVQIRLEKPTRGRRATK